MLAVQKWLFDNNGDYEKLNAELGIKATFKDNLVLLNYDQIDSPKINPIVSECRGICLERDSFKLVAKAFNRFYNFGEALEVTGKFDWTNFSVLEKMDGSLVKIFKYKGELHIQTRGSFADGELIPGLTWYEAIKKCLTQEAIDKMPEGYTHIFEFCSIMNKVVVTHPETHLVLLGINYIEDFDYMELTEGAVDLIAGYPLNVKRPTKFTFTNYDEIKKFVEAATDKVWEGVVIRDCNNVRQKIKNSKYLGLHHLFDNGNIFRNKYLLPYVLDGEKDELLIYAPEIEPFYEKLEAKTLEAFATLRAAWESSKDIEDQKEFALEVTKRNPTPFSGILFNLKKNKTIHDEKELVSMWRESRDLILKIVGD